MSDEKGRRDHAIQLVDDALDEMYHKGRADEQGKWVKELELMAAMGRVIEVVKKVIEGPHEDEYDGDPSLVDEFEALKEYLENNDNT
jgi:hypothetical protein